MKYYRCKCGKKTAWSTRGVQDCEGCKECGTTLAEHPEEHKPVADHAAVVYYRQTDGSPYLVCSKCSSTALGYSPEEEADVIKNLQLIDKVLNGEQYKPEPVGCVVTGEGIDELLSAIKLAEKSIFENTKHGAGNWLMMPDTAANREMMFEMFGEFEQVGDNLVVRSEKKAGTS